MPRGSGLIGRPSNRKKCTKDTPLSSRELIFVDHICAGVPCLEAARLAGYANPQSMGTHLRDPSKHPNVVAELDKRRLKKESIADKKAADVQRILSVGAFMDPRPWFEPGSIDGQYWLISKENYLALPLDIARHIKYSEKEVTYEEDENGVVTPVDTGMIRVKLTDKETLISICSKAMLGEKVNVSGTIMQLNWGDMQRRAELTSAPEPVDPIEAQILAISDRGTTLTSSTLPSSALASSIGQGTVLSTNLSSKESVPINTNSVPEQASISDGEVKGQ